MRPDLIVTYNNFGDITSNRPGICTYYHPNGFNVAEIGKIKVESTSAYSSFPENNNTTNITYSDDNSNNNTYRPNTISATISRIKNCFGYLYSGIVDFFKIFHKTAPLQQ